MDGQRAHLPCSYCTTTVQYYTHISRIDRQVYRSIFRRPRIFPPTNVQYNAPLIFGVLFKRCWEISRLQVQFPFPFSSILLSQCRRRRSHQREVSQRGRQGVRKGFLPIPFGGEGIFFASALPSFHLSPFLLSLHSKVAGGGSPLFPGGEVGGGGGRGVLLIVLLPPSVFFFPFYLRRSRQVMERSQLLLLLLGGFLGTTFDAPMGPCRGVSPQF